MSEAVTDTADAPRLAAASCVKETASLPNNSRSWSPMAPIPIREPARVQLPQRARMHRESPGRTRVRRVDAPLKHGAGDPPRGQIPGQKQPRRPRPHHHDLLRVVHAPRVLVHCSASPSRPPSVADSVKLHHQIGQQALANACG